MLLLLLSLLFHLEQCGGNKRQREVNKKKTRRKSKKMNTVNKEKIDKTMLLSLSLLFHLEQWREQKTARTRRKQEEKQENEYSELRKNG